MHPTSGGALIGVGGELGERSDSAMARRPPRRISCHASDSPPRYLDPGVADAERQLAWRGVALVGSVKSDRLVEVTAAGHATGGSAASARAAVRQAVASSVAPWSARSAAVVSAILIGDRAGLDAEVERRLQEAGTYHVIAISGGNIAILAGSVHLRCCASRRAGPRSSALLVIVMLAAYAFVVEGGSSVGRATLMAAIYFAAQMWDHRTLPLNVAALTAAILFCVRSASGRRCRLRAHLRRDTRHSRRHVEACGCCCPASPWLRAPAALLRCVACAEIALLPIGAFVFSRVTFAGLIVNFAAIPLMTVVQIAGMAAVGADVAVA